MTQDVTLFDETARQVVELANRLAEANPDADLWDIADGMLAGVVHYWLYSRQPCGDPRCEDCAPISTAEQRVAELLHSTEQFAQDSDYYHSPTDSNVGRA